MPPSVIGSSKSAKIPWPTRAQRAALTSQIALALALIFPGLGECFIWQRLGGFRFCFFMLLVRPIYDISSVEVHSFETSGSWFSCVPLPGKLHSLHPRKVIIYSKLAESASVPFAEDTTALFVHVLSQVAGRRTSKFLFRGNIIISRRLN